MSSAQVHSDYEQRLSDFSSVVVALPSEEREVVRHCTLTPDLVAAKRSPHNRLVAYVLLSSSATPAAGSKVRGPASAQDGQLQPLGSDGAAV